jgi:Spy/CpxP family protein refolding chaperone
MKKSLIALLLTGFLSTLIAFSQTAPANPGGQGGQGGRGGRGGGGTGGFGGGALGGARVLDDQQMQLYREAVQKDRDKLTALDEKLRAAQKELIDATLASNYDEKVVREKAEAVGKIQTEITVLRAKGLATVAPTLKPEQKQQLVESRMAVMMLGVGSFDMGAFGGRGGFGGRADTGGGGRGADRGGRGGGGR